MMKLKLLTVAILGAMSASSYAFSPITVNQIKIEGANRIEKGTIVSYLPLRKGETFDEARANEALKALYRTGFFDDVQLAVDNDIIVITVQERPVIGQFSFEGMSDFPEEDLKKSLRGAGLAEGMVLDRALLDQAIQELQKQYYAKGKYSVQITPEVTPLSDNRLAVKLRVSEGLSAKIQKINIIGNQAFSNRKLLGLLESNTGSWNPLNRNNIYSKQRFAGDLEILRSYYMNRGYLEFDIPVSQVEISPDKKQVYLNVTLKEGSRFNFGDVTFEGDTLWPAEDLKALVDFKKGDVFSRAAVMEAVNAITEHYSDEGYAFVNVNAIPQIDAEKKVVGFTFMIDPGKRAYVRRINIVGNTRTRDVVVRRELRQVESGWFSGSAIKRSKTRLDQLGYFDELNVTTEPVTGTSDQLDVFVRVKEKQTGNFTLGAGFNQGEGFVLSGKVSQSNVFGSGNFLSVDVNTSKANRVLALSYVNPYYTVDGISRGFDVYQRNTDASKLDKGPYKTQNTGGKVRFTVPVNEEDNINFSLGLEHTKVELLEPIDTNARYYQYVQIFGNKTLSVLGNIGWQRDRRDSFTYPTKGMFQRLDLGTALPGGDVKYWRLEYQNQYFMKLSKSFTLLWNQEWGFANGYGGKELPFFQNFYAGGESSVRGYKSSSLGLRDSEDDPLGGNRRFVSNLELLFPLPNREDDKSLRLSAFVDGGSVWAKSQKMAVKDLRFSAGLAVTWISPLGPMKFSYALPLNKKEGDKVQSFQFNLGNIF